MDAASDAHPLIVSQATVRVFDFNSALLRLPGRSVVHGLRAHSGPGPGYEAVLAEQAAYIGALQNAGVRASVLEPLEEFPDSIFVEDPALVFSEAAVLLRPGAPSRRAEAQALAPALESRFRTLLRLEHGCVEGGDILVTPECVYIGLSRRTDEAGAAGLQVLLASLGIASRVVETPPGTLHLKSDCSLVDTETLLATADLARSGTFDGFRILVVPQEERAAANALRVNDVMLVSAGYPRTAEALAKHGVKVVALPVAEIARIDAGLSCMSLRWFDPGLQ